MQTREKKLAIALGTVVGLMAVFLALRTSRGLLTRPSSNTFDLIGLGSFQGTDFSTVYTTNVDATEAEERVDGAAEGGEPHEAQTSRWLTYFAFRSMNLRRGSTASPINVEKMRSAAAASSTVTLWSRRVSGFMVVSQSCSGFISPSPLYR